MKRSLLLTLFFLSLVGLLAAGCAPASRAEAALQATVTPAGTAETATTAVPTDTQPVALPESATQPDANCIACHSNVEELQLVAEPTPVVESLNEGSG